MFSFMDNSSLFVLPLYSEPCIKRINNIRKKKDIDRVKSLLLLNHHRTKLYPGCRKTTKEG